jgi:exopolysaccharide biosynthesis polyprenyl glycosylphosphotransferase
MQSLRRRILLNGYCVSDVLVMALAFSIASFFSAQETSLNFEEFLSVRIKLTNLLLFLCFAAAWYLIFSWHGLYRSRRIGQMTAEWWEVTKSVTLATLLLSTIAFLADLSAVNRPFLAAFFISSLIATLLTRTALRYVLVGARQKGRNLRNIVIVGCGPRGAALGKEIRKRPEFGYLMLGYIDDIPPPKNPLHGEPEKLLGSLDGAEKILENLEIDEVFIALPVVSYFETTAKIVAACETLGLIVRIPADLFQLRLAKADVDYLDETAVLTLQTGTPAAFDLALKRTFDVLCAAVALVLLSPVCAVIAGAIKFDSPGPVFFRQERIGLGRKRFSLVKFRTMVSDAEDRLKNLETCNEVNGAAFKMKDDPRVTRLGRVLRKFSLDELPQLINVLKGDMSLVGPRPLPIRDVERFDSRWQKRRFSVKPGITCLWQVNGRHDISFEHWMELDLQYIDHWSLKLDFEIMLKTIPAVLRGTGAS